VDNFYVPPRERNAEIPAGRTSPKEEYKSAVNDARDRGYSWREMWTFKRTYAKAFRSGLVSLDDAKELATQAVRARKVRSG
jgi:hypothetical protein